MIENTAPTRVNKTESVEHQDDNTSFIHHLKKKKMVLNECAVGNYLFFLENKNFLKGTKNTSLTKIENNNHSSMANNLQFINDAQKRKLLKNDEITTKNARTEGTKAKPESIKTEGIKAKPESIKTKVIKPANEKSVGIKHESVHHGEETHDYAKLVGAKLETVSSKDTDITSKPKEAINHLSEDKIKHTDHIKNLKPSSLHNKSSIADKKTITNKVETSLNDIPVLKQESNPTALHYQLNDVQQPITNNQYKQALQNASKMIENMDAKQVEQSHENTMSYQFKSWPGEHSVKISIPTQIDVQKNLSLLPSDMLTSHALNLHKDDLSDYQITLFQEKDENGEQKRDRQDSQNEDS